MKYGTVISFDEVNDRGLIIADSDREELYFSKSTSNILLAAELLKPGSRLSYEVSTNKGQSMVVITGIASTMLEEEMKRKK